MRPEPDLQKVAAFPEGESIGAEKSASELTFFLGGAANEAAFARDAGTRDGGQRYWGGEQGDGHVCRALGWSEVGKGSLSAVGKKRKKSQNIPANFRFFGQTTESRCAGR